ncbi:MAG TPA: hypothetical protein VFW11_23235 [Cyclobacteriaceae bacterium]|nr:hypothetical protein [Cyclobacteriaceae bacterium]
MNFFSETITYKRAGQYLAEFADELKDIFSLHLGGTLLAAPLKEWATMPGFSGVMTWFCLDKSNPLAAKVFLAFEKKIDFVIPRPDPSKPLEPETDNLLIPSQRFGYSLRSIKDYETFLRNHKMAPPIENALLHSVSVMRYFKEYLDADPIKPFQRYGYGYFENSPDGGNKDIIKNFLATTGLEYVRYYFGFCPRAEADPNFIRIILVPVDKEGKNISEQSILSDPPLVQKSVPPPPL